MAVCVATCRRPTLLAALLESLAAQRFPKRPEVRPRIVVVDNDAAGSAREVVRAAAESSPWPVEYAVEPRRNISLARNLAVALAIAPGCDFVAFIDDDEVAHPGWVDELVDVQARFSADVVNGRVVSRYQDGVDPWVIEGAFFEHGHAPTGARLGMAATNNVLVAAHLLADPAGPFDPAFGLSGGGDSHLFARLRDRGATMVWADDAVVEELVPRSRASARWILRRSFRMGNAGVYCERDFLPGRRWMAVRAAKAVTRLGLGALLLAPALARGRAPTVAALQKIFHSLGAVAALAGFRYEEYRVIHGE